MIDLRDPHNPNNPQAEVPAAPDQVPPAPAGAVRPLGHRGLFRRHAPLQTRDDFITYQIFIVLGILLVGMAFLFDSPRAIWDGSIVILTSPANLLTDYIRIGGVGAAFFNAGIMTLASVLLIQRNHSAISGALMAAVFTVAGFSFFGKNLYNSVPIVLGVMLFARLSRQPSSRFLVHALFGSALGPLISEITFNLPLPLALSLPLGIASGVLAGFLLPPLSTHFLRFHQGFSLYNIGFTAGIVGTFFIAVLRALGIDVVPVSILSSGNNQPFAIFLGLLFLGILLWGLANNRGSLAGYRQMLTQSGKLATDFVKINGIGLTLINMGFLGLISTAYVLLIGGELNGPIIGGIFTVVGFGAFGKHVRNVVPIFIGVLLANLLNIYDPRSTTALLATLFGTTLAPIAGYYGAGWGIVAAMLHMALVMNISYLHGGVNLYNNGFSGGFVAAALVPVIESIRAIVRERSRPGL